MVPAQPPLPTASYFPFQLAAGSWTTILMSESVDGLSVAATRQWAGDAACAGIESAAVIVVCGSESDLSRSHGVCAAAVKAPADNSANLRSIEHTCIRKAPRIILYLNPS